MLEHGSRMSIVALVALALVSCGNAPADVAGSYTVALTNGANGCMFMDWTVGESTSGVGLVITQDGDAFTGTVTGAVAGALDLYVGSHEFNGTVSGTHLDGTLVGRPLSMGTCAYTLNIDLDGELDGDLITGSLRWYGDANSSPDCGMWATCETLQAFNGTRPP